MQYLKISNKGLLSVELLHLMGGTTKREDNTKVGFYGTGSKNAIAWLLRNNIDFKLFVGKKEIPITTKPVQVRDHKFDVVSIDGKETSITTKMGADYTNFMCIREIYCNSLDEGEEQVEVVSEVLPEENRTSFFIQYTTEIQQVYKNWGNYFIHNQTPMYEDDDIAIYSGGDSLRVYKQGVLIHEKKEDNKKSLFSYDLKKARINELREYKGYPSHDIPMKLLKLKSEKILDYFLSNLKDHHFEYEWEYDWAFTDISSAWKQTIGNARIIDNDSFDSLSKRGSIKEKDKDTMIVLPKSLHTKLSQSIKGVSALRAVDKVNSFYEIPDEETESILNQCLAILETCDYEVAEELNWKFGYFGDKRVFGQIEIDTATVMLSNDLKHKSLFDFVATIVEENEHYRTGFNDETRDFQQHFINLFVKQILAKNEVRL